MTTPRLVFLHLPKTAGTSLRAAFADQGVSVSPAFPASHLSPDEAKQLSASHVICGHLSFDDFRRYWFGTPTITVLRDPVERCLSWYWFARDSVPQDHPAADVQLAKRCTIDEFFRADREVLHRNIINRQTRQLATHVFDRSHSDSELLSLAREHLSDMFWFGLQESLESDVGALFRKLGLAPPPVGRLNVSTRKERRAPDPQTLALIRELNALDIQLVDQLSAIRHPTPRVDETTPT